MLVVRCLLLRRRRGDIELLHTIFGAVSIIDRFRLNKTPSHVSQQHAGIDSRHLLDVIRHILLCTP